MSSAGSADKASRTGDWQRERNAMQMFRICMYYACLNACGWDAKRNYIMNQVCSLPVSLSLALSPSLKRNHKRLGEKVWAARVVSYLCIFSYSCNRSHTQLVTTKWRREHCKNICSLSLCRLASESRRGKGTLLMQLCVSPRCVLAVVEMHTHTHTHTKRSFFICRVLPPCCSLCCLFSARLSCRFSSPCVWGCVSECVRIFKRKYTWIVICYPVSLSLPLPLVSLCWQCILCARCQLSVWLFWVLCENKHQADVLRSVWSTLCWGDALYNA